NAWVCLNTYYKGVEKDVCESNNSGIFFFLHAGDVIRSFCLSRGLGDVYKRKVLNKFERCN
ncbi:hypothetical protein BUY43_10875, partial [Staphylococcus devriesei]